MKVFLSTHFYFWVFLLLNYIGFLSSWKGTQGLPLGLGLSFLLAYMSFNIYQSLPLKRGHAKETCFLKRYTPTIHKVLICLSLLATAIMITKAGVSPFEYISNVNKYRLGVNKDVGYLKIIINLYMLFATVDYIRNSNRNNRFSFLFACFLNVFFAYRYAMAFSVFSLFLFYIQSGKYSFRHSFYIIFFLFLFGVFAMWRAFNYMGDGETFFSYFQVTSFFGLVKAFLYHGFLAHFVIFFHFDDVIRYLDQYPNYHYGMEYLYQFFRLIKLGEFLDLGYSLADRVNAHINNIDIITFLSNDAGGVVLGISGSGMLLGGYIGLYTIVFLWLVILDKMLYNIRKSAQSQCIVLIPYVMMVFQSPETNIPRLIFIWIVIFLMNILMNAIDDQKFYR